MGKYYAVKTGRVPGIYDNWEECRGQVEGYSGAEYKSFKLKKDAKAYIMGEEPEQEKLKQDMPEPNSRKPLPAPEPAESECEAVVYVDGSYNVKTGEYSFGAVLIINGAMYGFSHRYNDEDAAKMRNVAGEIAGAEFALKYAQQMGIGSIEIFYDYQGIASWALGEWKANLEATQRYAQLYRKISEQVYVKFTKEKGHSGDLYNDMADRIAKNELGIK